MSKPRTLDLTSTGEYYSSKLSEHGPTPKGVDWNGASSQSLRFEQLMKIVRDPGGPYSINDLGCGYGALVEYLQPISNAFDYVGYDVSDEMIAAAAARFSALSNVSFISAERPNRTAEYSVASGVFNVRLEAPDEQWYQYLLANLDDLDSSSSLGFAFNCLTIFSDADKMRPYLYYADPAKLFRHCKERYSRNVALLHDYDLYEFTILVRKDYD